MGYDGSGNYNRQRNFSADASAGIKILASAMDQEMDDIASAMTLPLLRDGQNAATGNIPMGGNRFTNVGAPVSASDYTRARDLITNIPIYMIDTETSTDRISVSAAYFTTASANAAPAGGTGVIIKMGSNKGSAPAIFLNAGDGSPYSANVVLNDGSALYSGAIVSGGIYEFIFASAASVWHLMNPSFRIATTDTPGLVEAATTAEGQTGTDTTRYITPAVMAAKFSADYATTASAGLVELATTAEGFSADNVSAVITPAVLNQVLSVNVATTASAGNIEIATTAEFLSASSDSLAVTPAHLGYMLYGMIGQVASASASVMNTSHNASTWELTALATGSYAVIHNIGDVGANDLVIQIDVAGSWGSQPVLTARLVSAPSASGFAFTVVDTSGSATGTSCNVHINVMRIT